jgi:signal transduction histidine kinase
MNAGFRRTSAGLQLRTACLAIPTLALSNAGPAAGSGGSRLVTTGIAVAMGIWYWWFIARRPRPPGRLLPGALRFVVLLAFLVVLLRRDPSYSPLVYGLVPQPYLLLPGRWAYAGATVLVVVWAAVSGLVTDGRLDGGGLWNLAGNLGLVLVVGWFINTIARQSEEQRAMLAELTRARARLAEQSRQAGILEERGRLAREIHDTLAQGLSGVVMQLEATEQALPHDPDRGGRHLAAAKRLARESLADAGRRAHGPAHARDGRRGCHRPPASPTCSTSSASTTAPRRWPRRSSAATSSGRQWRMRTYVREERRHDPARRPRRLLRIGRAA